MPRTIQWYTRRLALHAIAGGSALLVAFAVTLTFSAPAGCADNANQNSYGGRKVLARIEPEYPADLKAAGIGGYVHLSVTISPNGTVVSSQVLGGNPILAESAAKAIAKWKFSPAATTTSAEIWFHFGQSSF